MKRLASFLLVATIAFMPVLAGSFREVVSIGWGAGAGLREIAGRRFGPADFSVRGDRLLLLDESRSRVSEYDLTTGRLVRQSTLPDGGSPACWRRDNTDDVFKGAVESGDPAVFKADACTVDVLAAGNTFQYRHPVPLGAVELLSCDGENFLLRTEEILQPSPIRTKEYILTVDRHGSLRGRISLPPVYFAYVPRNLRVVGDKLYCLLAAPDGLHLFWLPLAEAAEGYFPVEWFANPCHFNENILAEPEAPLEKQENASAELPVSRGQIMAAAVPYQEVSWTAGTSNISNGVVVLPDGAYIRTPAWVTVGRHSSVPYKWAGWTELSVFRDAIKTGKYAGDNFIDDSVLDYSWGDAYCVGLDCSGYVSRAWHTAKKYSTSTLPKISTAYDSYAKLKRGDALNLAGSHVMLFAGFDPSGEVVVLEASGDDWRVSYRTYTLTELIDYVPRYFTLVTEEDPAETAFVVKVRGEGTVTVFEEPDGAAVTTVSGGQLFVSGEYADGWYRLWFPFRSGFARGWCYGGTSDGNGMLEGCPATPMVRCVTGSLFIRTGPSTSDPAFTSMTFGQRFAVLETQGNWARISLPACAGRSEGWASLSYLETTVSGGPCSAVVLAVDSPSEAAPGETVPVSVRLRNAGASPFDGDTLLRTTQPRSHDSPLADASWRDPSTPLRLAVPTLPGQETTLHFDLRIPETARGGEVVEESFNLCHAVAGWFSDSPNGGPSDGEIHVRITVRARPGDLNGDGVTDALDAALLAGFLTGNTAFPKGSGAADLDGDGRATAADLVLLLRVLL